MTDTADERKPPLSDEVGYDVAQAVLAARALVLSEFLLDGEGGAEPFRGRQIMKDPISRGAAFS